ncbi:MAG: ATP-binding protein [Streptococcaceae bacterium]|jgi:predicted AAA+ superfamily ATPase|nr:ATP-binding protein [Streptococcaceae bacterium]
MNENKYVRREGYLDFLHRLRDKDVMKVISGVRRSGKSTLLQLFVNDLKQNGVADTCIQIINFENLANYALRDFLKLHEHVREHLVEGKMNYIILDEVQHVKEFERVVDSLYVTENVDVYITGSNAFFLSGELATLLSGRYVELKILPLSFKEFYIWKQAYEAKQLQRTKREWIDEYTKSSFPYVLFIDDEITLEDYLEGIYSTILLKDVVARIGVKDVNTLERIIQYLASIVGSEFVAKTVKNVFASSGLTLSHETITRFLGALEESMFVYKVRKFNVRGKRLLDTRYKYYLVDVGLRRILLPDVEKDFGHILENIVYLELLRRGNKVFVGKIDEYEIDFIAEDKNHIKTYYQVSLNTEDEDTLKQELRPLKRVDDQYPKYLITLDELSPSANYNGIQKLNAFDWLLNI